MQIMIAATVLGGSRRFRAASADKPAATYAEIHIATDLDGKPEDVAGQSVTTLRLGDPRFIDTLRHSKLPAQFLLICDQQTYGEATRTIVTEVRDALKPAAVSKAS